MNSVRPGVGLVSVDENGYWPGGRYYLHHIVRSVALLEPDERLPMRDAWWLKRSDGDTSFDDVRDVLDGSAVIDPPAGFGSRFIRRVSRAARGRDDFGDLFAAAGVDVLFPTSACDKPGVPMVYWLTDFQHKRLPELYTAELFEWFEKNFAAKVRQAELVMLSSKDAYSDFQRYFPEQSHKARLVLCASTPNAEWFALEPDSTASRKGLAPGYFVLPNQFTEHKNHLTVFEAVRILKSRGVEIQLACTGHSLDYKGKRHVERLLRFIEDNGLARNIRMLGFLPRAEQMALYRGARAILQPSRFEGWSSAIEDAASLGREAIVSDIAIHREKDIGAIVSFIDPDDPEAWADALGAAHRETDRQTREDEAAAVARAQLRATSAGKAFVSLMREAIAGARQRSAA